jgi:hypothetical protein
MPWLGTGEEIMSGEGAEAVQIPARCSSSGSSRREALCLRSN